MKPAHCTGSIIYRSEQIFMNREVFTSKLHETVSSIKILDFIKVMYFHKKCVFVAIQAMGNTWKVFFADLSIIEVTSCF